jgi:site-specific DNA recombinase
MRALIYTRVSSDPRGSLRSVNEQEVECRAVCERNGWPVVDVLTDNDRSASRFARKSRPAWESLKERLRNGEADVLVVWESSRATRDLVEYAAFQELCLATGVVFCAGTQVINFENPSDALGADIRAVVSKAESADARHRVRRAMASNALMGRPHGRRVYGYMRDYDSTTGALVGQHPDPAEAAVVAEIVDRLLAGHSLRTLTGDLNARGITTSTGVAWDAQTVKRTAVNPAYAALRVHQGKVVGEAAWEPIIDHDKHGRIVAILTDPKRKTTRQRERAHLLSGVAHCGRCGSRMTYGKNRRSHMVYVCHDNRHMTVAGPALEQYVVAVVLARLSREDGLAAVATTPTPEVLDARAKVDTLRARLDDAADQYAAGKITAEMLARVESRVLGELAEAERASRFAGMPSTVADLAAGDDVEAVWDSITLEQQVEVIRSMMNLTILPGKPSHSFRPEDRVRIEWRF